MAKSSKKKLAYMAERQKSPAEVKKRVTRNRDRRHALKAGTVTKGGADIGHGPAGVGKGKPRPESVAHNRGWRGRKSEAKKYG